MARGDWIDAGSSSLSSRSGAKQGFYYRYSNTLEDAITDNKDIIQVIPYGFRTGTGTTAYAYTTLTSSFTYKIGSNIAVSTSMGTQYDYSDATTVNKIYYFTSSTPFKRMSGATLLSSVNGKTGYGFAFENPHNEDGTSNAVIMTWFFNGSDSHGDATKSITITPDAIPRGSTLGEIADFELDSSFAINITKYVSSYTDNLVIKVNGTTIKTYSGISNGDTVSFTTTEQTTIKGLVPSPQTPIIFELSSYSGSVQIGTTSTRTATASTLDVPILDSWSKKSNGHYQYAINGLVDDTIDDVFQVYDDEGNLINGDSGWKLATLKDSFVVYDTSSIEPRYRKIGKIVEIQGAVKPTSALVGSNDEVIIFNLPLGFRPNVSGRITNLCQGSDKNTWLLSINSNGNVTFSRYGTTANTSASTSTWLPFQAMFTID
jgi:hypothetical protein